MIVTLTEKNEMIKITIYQGIPSREIEKDRINVGNADSFQDVVVNLSQRLYQDIEDNGQWYRVTAVHAIGGDGTLYPVWGLRTGYTKDIAWNGSFLRGYNDAIQGNTLYTQKYGDAVLRLVYNPVDLEFRDTDSVDGIIALPSTPAISCAVCGKESAHRCSACKVTTYCDKECQRMDWHTGGHSVSCTGQHSATPADVQIK